MDVMNLGSNDWVTCPFDPVHRIKYSKFHNHFVKCRKQHPDDQRKQCPYNASELIEINDYENHLIECPYQTLYFNVGQFKQDLPVYDAPSHFDIGEHLIPRRKSHINCDSDDEFDSVSTYFGGAHKSYNEVPRLLPKKGIRQDECCESVATHKSATQGTSISAKSAEKKGFGRGAWMKQMLAKRESISTSTANDDSDEKPASHRAKFTGDSNEIDQISYAIRPGKNDSHSFTKRFGRGRGAIFQTDFDDSF